MKLILIGKSCSGKDSYAKYLIKKYGFRLSKSYTTRTPREDELKLDEKLRPYYYISTDDFERMIKSGQMVEYVMFNGNYYGQTIYEITESDIIIMTPDKIKLIPENIRKECVIVWIDCQCNERIRRMKEYRKWTHEQIVSRVMDDEELFSEWDGKYDFYVDTTNG